MTAPNKPKGKGKDGGGVKPASAPSGQPVEHPTRMPRNGGTYKDRSVTDRPAGGYDRK